jgi:hypothetical protein
MGEFEDIKGYEGKYGVNEKGEVISYKLKKRGKDGAFCK